MLSTSFGLKCPTCRGSNRWFSRASVGSEIHHLAVVTNYDLVTNYWEWSGSSVSQGGQLHVLTSSLPNKEFIWAITGHKMIHKHKTGAHKHGYIWTFLCCCISKTSFTSLNKRKHARRSVFVYKSLTPLRTPVPFTMVTSWQFRHDGVDIWKGLCLLGEQLFGFYTSSSYSETITCRQHDPSSRHMSPHVTLTINKRIEYITVSDWRLS